MRRFFAFPIRSSSLVVLLMLSAFFSPLYGGAPRRGAIEIAGSVTGSHAVTTGDPEEAVKYSKGSLELDLGMGYFLTDLFEFMSRVEWTGGSSRRESGDYNHDFSGGAVYGVSGLLVVNRPTEKAGVLFLGIGGGIMASGGFNIEPVQFPVLEAGTRVFLGSSASLNVAAYYERRRFEWGLDNMTANSYGLKAGFSFFPLTASGSRESER